MNVGATAPEEYGDYFAWGEVEPYYEDGYAQEAPQAHWKEDKSGGYGWANYKWCNGTQGTMTKYCDNSRDGYNGYTDSKTVLDLDDDVAHVRWGGNWRIPTKDDCLELFKNCTWTWTVLKVARLLAIYQVIPTASSSCLLPGRMAMVIRMVLSFITQALLATTG